jgi:hypothetical protein
VKPVALRAGPDHALNAIDAGQLAKINAMFTVPIAGLTGADTSTAAAGTTSFSAITA